MGQVDLLKVDVEGAEEAVLLGIREGEWASIQAAVIEVHDTDGRLERIQVRPQRAGWRITTVKSPQHTAHPCAAVGYVQGARAHPLHGVSRAIVRARQNAIP